MNTMTTTEYDAMQADAAAQQRAGVEADDASLNEITEAVARLRALIESKQRDCWTQSAATGLQSMADKLRSLTPIADRTRGALNEEYPS